MTHFLPVLLHTKQEGSVHDSVSSWLYYMNPGFRDSSSAGVHDCALAVHIMATHHGTQGLTGTQTPIDIRVHLTRRNRHRGFGGRGKRAHFHPSPSQNLLLQNPKQYLSWSNSTLSLHSHLPICQRK